MVATRIKVLRQATPAPLTAGNAGFVHACARAESDQVLQRRDKCMRDGRHAHLDHVLRRITDDLLLRDLCHECFFVVAGFSRPPAPHGVVVVRPGVDDHVFFVVVR